MTGSSRMLGGMVLISACLLIGACGGEGGDNPPPRPANNPSLTALMLEQATLVPAFDARTTRYTAEVANAVATTRVTATAANPAAAIRVNDAPVDSGAPSDPIVLAEGDNTINTVVTSEDGTRSRTYTVSVRRRPPPSDNADLDALTLTVAHLEQIFDPQRLTYTASAGYLGTSTRVTATAADSGATVTVNGTLLVPGQPSAPIALTVGANRLAVLVTAEDGAATRRYQIDLTRGPRVAVEHEAYVKASNTGPDLFGNGVAVTDVPGLPTIGVGVAIDRRGLVVGAPREDSAATGIDGRQFDETQANAGAAYFFERNATDWYQIAYVKASNTESGDLFGRSVDLEADLLAIGATGEDSAATRINGDQLSNSAGAAGAAYAFEREASGAWRQSAYLKPSNTDAGDQFGGAVSVHGRRVLIGARFEDSSATGVDGNALDNRASAAGAAYLFEYSTTGRWRQTSYLKASNTAAFDEFGASVALAGDTLAVGARGEDGGDGGIDGNDRDDSARDAGAVYLFEQADSGDWRPAAYVKAAHPVALDYFGTSVALDAGLLAVGAPGQNSAVAGIDGEETDQSLLDAGAVYVFERDGTGSWSQSAFIKASHPRAYDLFGASVALHGNLLVVGAPGQNSAAAGVDGFERDESARNAGATYVFERSATGRWSQIAFIKASNPDAGDEFGGAVDAWGDAVVVGAQFERSADVGINGATSDDSLPDAGAVYVIR